jgi:hypothetical protein
VGAFEAPGTCLRWWTHVGGVGDALEASGARLRCLGYVGGVGDTFLAWGRIWGGVDTVEATGTCSKRR